MLQQPDSPPPKRRAAFLDRDGVINRDHGYVYRIEDFEFLPGVVAALVQLAQQGYLLVVVTNQSGIGRGLYTEQDFVTLSEQVAERLASAGVAFAAVRHCPHHPDALLAQWRSVCDCRKPAPGMIVDAAAELDIDLAASILVGDKASDIAAGRAAGVGRCFLVGASPDRGAADAVFADLSACVAALA
jgi:D-glycero-D-manno-heptose 1,7-bisphosphate phosphatase